MLRTILPMLALGFAIAIPTARAVQINEYLPNPTGDEGANSFIEFRGIPGTSLDGHFLVTIEGDGSAAGAVNNVIDLTGLSIGPDGLATIIGGAANIENPTHTLVLADGFTGDPGTSPSANDGDDLDADNDGLIDLSPPIFGTVLDALGVRDSAGDLVYGAALGGIDLGFVPEFDPLPSDEPQVVFRDRISGLFYQASLDFSIAADASGTLIDGSLFDIIGATPAAPNPTLIPEPAAIASFLIGIALAGSLLRHRHA